MKLKNRIDTVKTKRISPSELESLRRSAKNTIVRLGSPEFSLNDIVIQNIRRGRRNSAFLARRIAASRSGNKRKVLY